MSRLRPAFFPVGVSLGPWCIALSGICALAAPLAASVIPAWRATRVSPLEAMGGAAAGATGAAFLGTHGRRPGVDLASSPLVVFWLPMPDKSRYAVSALVGCPTMGIGFILLAPLTVAFHGQVLRADHRAAAGGQLAATRHATYQQPLAGPWAPQPR